MVSDWFQVVLGRPSAAESGFSRARVAESGQKVVSDWFQVVSGRPSAAESGFQPGGGRLKSGLARLKVVSAEWLVPLK